jgi:hypothetical protein
MDIKRPHQKTKQKKLNRKKEGRRIRRRSTGDIQLK